MMWGWERELSPSLAMPRAAQSGAELPEFGLLALDRGA